MRKTTWAVLGLVSAAVMAVISIVSAVMGGCSTMVELANGNSMPMKCHWTFVAVLFVGIVGVVIGVMGAMCKDQSGRRMAGVGTIACALVIACLPSTIGIGLCASSEMHCHTTALVVWVLCAVSAVLGIVQIVKSRPVDRS